MKYVSGLELVHHVRRLEHLDTPIPSELTGTSLRKFVFALCISEFGFITAKQAELILVLMSREKITKGSVPILATRALNGVEFVKILPKKEDAGSVSIVYRLTKKGENYTETMIRLLLDTLPLPNDTTFHPEFFWSNFNKDMSRFPLRPHGIMINTQSLIAAFSVPLNDEAVLDYKREYNFASVYHMYSHDLKRDGSFSSDFLLSFLPDNRKLAVEVDLDTERIERLIDKLRSYEDLSRNIPIDVTFLFDPADSIQVGVDQHASLSQQQKAVAAIKASRRFTNTEMDTLKTIIEIFMHSHSSELCLRDFVSCINAKAEIHKDIEKSGWYRIMDFLYQYLEGWELCDYPVFDDERGVVPLVELGPIIDELKNTDCCDYSIVTTMHEPSLLKRKRKALSKELMQHMNQCIRNGSYCGILSGMSVMASYQDTFWKNIRCIYPLLDFYDSDIIRLRNIGLNSSDPTIYWQDPAVFHVGKNELVLKYNIGYGDYCIAFENISEDIGGLFRVLSYLNLPYEPLADILLIALIDDDLMLSNGQKLGVDSLVWSRIQNAPEGSVGHRLFTSAQKSLKEGCKLRVDLQTGGGLVFMNYQEFEQTRLYPAEPFFLAATETKMKLINCFFT